MLPGLLWPCDILGRCRVLWPLWVRSEALGRKGAGLLVCVLGPAAESRWGFPCQMVEVKCSSLRRAHSF